jgi:hypothetical protein
LLSTLICAGCPAEEDPGDPGDTEVGHSSGDASGEAAGTEPGSASMPITDGDCHGVGLGCGADECCDGLVCMDGVCEDPNPSCAPTGEACDDDADCCGLCRSDGVCGPQECVPEGGACEAECCGELQCDENILQCSSTCAVFEEACDVDEDCCERACIDGSCGVLG